MKKFTLIAASAMVAMAANAQYTCDPKTADVVKQGPKTVEFLVLSEDSQQVLETAGATLQNWGPDDVTRFFYIWDNTFNPGDGSYPNVDMNDGQYLSLEVGSVGWSGGGYFIAGPTADKEGDVTGNGANTTVFNDNTRFHIAYMTPSGNGPSSIALIIVDGKNGENTSEVSSPAKVAVGTAFNDGGAIYPTIGPAANDDWQGVDISFADLKKLYPTFNYVACEHWSGNMLSILGGGVTGQTLALDTVYFYNTDGEGGVDAVFAENEISFLITENTVNVNGGNGIALYNVAGQLVKSTEGAALGISNLTPGVYVAVSHNKTAKVVVR